MTDYDADDSEGGCIMSDDGMMMMEADAEVNEYCYCYDV